MNLNVIYFTITEFTFVTFVWLPGVAQTLRDEILTLIGMLHIGNQARAFASSRVQSDTLIFVVFC
jgi:hypothetical protein